MHHLPSLVRNDLSLREDDAIDHLKSSPRSRVAAAITNDKERVNIADVPSERPTPPLRSLAVTGIECRSRVFSLCSCTCPQQTARPLLSLGFPAFPSMTSMTRKV